MRQVSDLNRQGTTIGDRWLEQNTEPLFEQLRQYLGDLEDSDENALLGQDEDFDPALLMFEEGADTVLDRFELRLNELEPQQLAQELATTARELVAFGQMANLASFI
ncbi:MAG: hybrid sensor histidine kinase/response regulator, partial [Phototrophicales bacterium]